VLREPVEREVRADVLPVAAPDGELSLPIVSNSCSLLERILAVQSLIWLLRLLICSLSAFLFDQRNTPAPTDAAATAAAAIGRSLTEFIQSLLYWLRPVGLLFWPRLLFFAIVDVLLVFVSNSTRWTEPCCGPAVRRDG